MTTAELIKRLSGKKTYITAFALLFVAILRYLGVLHEKESELLFGLLGGGLFIFMRNALRKNILGEK